MKNHLTFSLSHFLTFSFYFLLPMFIWFTTYISAYSQQHTIFQDTIAEENSANSLDSITYLISSSNLNAEIEKLKNDPDLKNASWGFCVLDIKNDSIIAEYNSHCSLIPASSLKAVTTATALYILGKNYKFKSQLMYDGEIDNNGILKGNIYIKGGGDPTLGYDRNRGIATYDEVISQWTSAIKGKGIKKIEGAVMADPSIFDDELIPVSWTWDNMGNYYGAGSSGLNIYENFFRILFQSGKKEGDSTKIINIIPELPNVQIINKVLTGPYGSGDNAIVYSPPYSDKIVIKGTIPPNKNEYEIRGAIPNPPYLVAYYLNKNLLANNITVTQNPTSTLMFTTKSDTTNNSIKKERKVIYTTYSKPLSDIIYWTNQKSINMYAETLVKMLAYNITGIGNTEVGCAIVKNFWKNRGVNVTGLNIHDGSGLSRKNTITPRQQVEILKIVAKDTVIYNVFNKSLPIAGESGTMSGLCIGSKAQYNLRAKSGYIERVRAYTGYVNAKDGRLLAFSMLVNNFTCTRSKMKRNFEKLMILMGEM